jgi:transcription elongation factor Elf1
MPSPIKQVELQQKLLREFLHHHRGNILSKLFGLRQQSFGKRCWHNLCAVSSNSIIEREFIPKSVSEVVVKSEFLIDKIKEVMKLKDSLIQSINVLDTRHDFNDDELQSITKFLIDNRIEATKSKQETTSLSKTIETVLKCKECNEALNYTPQHGRYGYFINCNKCKTNTSMKIHCNQCNSKNTKVSKKKEEYTLNCLDCDNQVQLIG